MESSGVLIVEASGGILSDWLGSGRQVSSQISTSGRDLLAGGSGRRQMGGMEGEGRKEEVKGGLG